MITNQNIPDVDQSDLVHQPESMELGAKILNSKSKKKPLPRIPAEGPRRIVSKKKGKIC